ncbi:MAG TPA: LD-carboxypeptidase [Vicinamibacterales bacterium]|nr:LD-carboxypeptidase [Vicinamibacterales bacterium]
MLRPRALRPGDRIALVAPASPFDRADFDRGVAELAALGFEPAYDDRVFARRGYLAGDPEDRARAFEDAWCDDRIAALIAVRGGYGSVQMLPRLSPERLRARPKLFIGYSDATALLLFLTQQCGIVAVHGPMVEGRLARGAGGYDRASFMACVTSGKPVGELSPPGLQALRSGEAIGTITGGNLSQLVASLGTPYAFDPPAGSVLFLEDVRERPYRIDRMVTQLRLAGVLDRAAAVVWGEMAGCDEESGKPTARDVIADLFGDFPGPVLFGFPSGHTTGPSLTLPFGVRTRVIAGDRVALSIEEAAVTT